MLVRWAGSAYVTIILLAFVGLFYLMVYGLFLFTDVFLGAVILGWQLHESFGD